MEFKIKLKILLEENMDIIINKNYDYIKKEEAKSILFDIIKNEKTIEIWFQFFNENKNYNIKWNIIWILGQFINKTDNKKIYFLIIYYIFNIIYNENLDINLKSKLANLFKFIKNQIDFIDKDYFFILKLILNKFNFNNLISNYFILINIFDNNYFINIDLKDQIFLIIVDVINKTFELLKKNINLNEILNNIENLTKIKLFINHISIILKNIFKIKQENDLIKGLIFNNDIIDLIFNILFINNEDNKIIMNDKYFNKKIYNEIIDTKSLILKNIFKIDNNEKINKINNYIINQIFIELIEYFRENLTDFKNLNNPLINDWIEFLTHKIINNEYIEIFEKYYEEIIVFILIPNFILNKIDYEELKNNPNDFFGKYIDCFNNSNDDYLLFNLSKLIQNYCSKIDNFILKINILIENLLWFLSNNDKKILTYLNNKTNNLFFNDLNKDNYLFLVFCLCCLLKNNWKMRNNLLEKQMNIIYEFYLKFKNEFNDLILIGFSIYIFIYSEIFLIYDNYSNILKEYLYFLINKINNNKILIVFLENIFQNVFCDLYEKYFDNKFYINNYKEFFKLIINMFWNNNLIFSDLILIFIENLKNHQNLQNEYLQLIEFISIYLSKENLKENKLTHDLFCILKSISSKKEIYINNYENFELSINNLFLIFKDSLTLNFDELNEFFINIILNLKNCSYMIFLLLDDSLNYINNTKNIDKCFFNIKLIYLITKYEFNLFDKNNNLIKKIKELSLLNNNYSAIYLIITIILCENSNKYLVNEEIYNLLTKINFESYYLFEDNLLRFYLIIFFNLILYKFDVIYIFLNNDKLKIFIESLINMNFVLKDKIIIKLYILSLLNILKIDNLKKISQNNFIILFKKLIDLFYYIEDINIKNPLKNKRIDEDFDQINLINYKNVERFLDILDKNSKVIEINELNIFKNYILFLENNNYNWYIVLVKNLNEEEQNKFNKLMNQNIISVYDQEENIIKERKIIKIKK